MLVVVAFLAGCLKDDQLNPAEALQQPARTGLTAEQSDQLVELITYSGKVIPGQYIVVYNDEAFPEARSIEAMPWAEQQKAMKETVATTISKYGIPSEKVTHVYGSAIRGFALSNLSDEELQQLRRESNIKYIEQDQEITVAMGGPPGGGGGGGGGGQTTPWGVTRVGGALDGTNAGTAWIIDSGIDLDHPDLNVDVGRSVSFLTGGGGAQSPNDQNGHGTHVAGTVGAIDNSEGVVGVAAGATLVAVRVLDRRGSGSYSVVIAGVDYVKANAASGDAANMSLGGPPSQALDDAVKAASNSCPFALAAGNESTNANNSSPARVNGANIYTVSSMAQGDVWSSFSNYGNPPVDYCAPGSSIYSTYKGGGYATLSGTSMAAPHVCGILLIGGITTDGTVSGDPDGNPDPIAHH